MEIQRLTGNNVSSSEAPCNDYTYLETEQPAQSQVKIKLPIGPSPKERSLRSNSTSRSREVSSGGSDYQDDQNDEDRQKMKHLLLHQRKHPMI